MSIQAYGIDYKTENDELKPEGTILLEYFNKIVKECRNNTKGRTYEDLDNEEDSFKRFQNRLGFFEDELNYIISDMISKVTYKVHKELLKDLRNEDCLNAWDYTEEPLADLNNYVKCLRKKVKAVIKIYNQHEFNNINLITGYNSYMDY